MGGYTFFSPEGRHQVWLSHCWMENRPLGKHGSIHSSTWDGLTMSWDIVTRNYCHIPPICPPGKYFATRAKIHYTFKK
jgi:hypothetical protein